MLLSKVIFTKGLVDSMTDQGATVIDKSTIPELPQGIVVGSFRTACHRLSSIAHPNNCDQLGLMVQILPKGRDGLHRPPLPSCCRH